MSITTAQHKTLTRTRRHGRVRAKISGTATRPRLCVYKSNRYLHAQVVDDTVGTTILAGSTKGIKGTKSEASVALGSLLASKIKAAGVEAIVFDRGGFRYAGRIAALAQAARDAGIKF